MSKNDYVFTPLIFNVNQFLSYFIAFVFSWMRPRPQGRAAAFVQAVFCILQAPQIDANFAAKLGVQIEKLFRARVNSLCKSCVNALFMRGEKRSIQHSAVSIQPMLPLIMSS